MVDPYLQAVVDQCSDHMNRIATMFKPGAEVTLIVRSPGCPERDFMLTNDDLQELSDLIWRRMEARGEANSR